MGMDKILTTNSIVVSPTGDCQSISAAIEKAKAGDRILVKQGVYQEDLVIDKPLEIIGDGDVANIVVESKNADCIFMKTDNALVRGLSLHNRAENGCAVNIPLGKLRLEYCEITSDSWLCVSIDGSETEGILSYCKIHDGDVFISEKATVHIDNCDIFGEDSGILILDFANTVVQNCKIYNGDGVTVSENSTGIINNCDIFGNYSGIAIADFANTVVKNCKIYNNRIHAILVYDKNRSGRIENCDIFDNASNGIEIKEGGNPVVQNCKIHHNGISGILVHANGTGTIENCDIFDNAFDAIEIIDGGNPVVQNCKIHDAKEDSGVYVSKNGRGRIENCDIFGNAFAGIAISEGGNPVVQNCTIKQNGYEAVWVYDNGAGTIENCDLRDNAKGAWDIESGCQVRRSGNKE